MKRRPDSSCVTIVASRAAAADTRATNGSQFAVLFSPADSTRPPSARVNLFDNTQKGLDDGDFFNEARLRQPQPQSRIRCKTFEKRIDHRERPSQSQ